MQRYLKDEQAEQGFSLLKLINVLPTTGMTADSGGHNNVNATMGSDDSNERKRKSLLHQQIYSTLKPNYSSCQKAHFYSTSPLPCPKALFSLSSTT